MIEDLRKKAAQLAYGLGIAVYVRDDRIYQHPPGEEFLPPKREISHLDFVKSEESKEGTEPK